MHAKTKHFVVLIFGLIFSFELLMSQDFDLTLSDYDFNLSTTSIHKIFGHDSSFYYVVKYSGNQYHIEKLDKDLNLVSAHPIKLHEGLKSYDFETIIHFHNEIIVFSSRRRFDDNIIYYHKINKDSLTSSTDFIKLVQIEYIKGNWADFHFAISRHESKLLMACRIKLNLSNVQHNQYFVFGENLEVVWQKKDYIEFKGQGPRDNKYYVDELGNISILSLLKRTNIFDIFSSVKNAYTIYRYTDNGDNYNEYVVTFPNKYIRGLRVTDNEKGNLICAGLFSETYGSGVKGTFYFKIDDNIGRINNINFHDFDEQLLSVLAENKEPLISDEEILSYVMSDLIYRKDGRIILIAEQVFGQTYNTYNNIIISCIDSLGQSYWNKVIQKKQDFNIQYLARLEIEPEDYRDYIVETGFMDDIIENYCSYTLLAPLDRNEIILFFNDNIKNIDSADKLRSFSHPKKSYIAAISIDEYGNINKQIIHKWVKKSLYPEPIRYYHNLYNTVIIPAYKGRKYNYYKITARF